MAASVSVPGRCWAVEFGKASVGSTQITVVRVDPRKDQLQLFLQDETGAPFRRFDRLADRLRTRGKSLSFAMNAGMYHADLSPVGLYVAEGRMSSPLNAAEGAGNFFLKPNGVFFLTASGAGVAESSEYVHLKPAAILATQSGPLLVRNGRIHSAFKPDSSSRLVRNGVGVTSRGNVVFAISDGPITFYDFALLFRDTLHCDNALYLDGVVSSLHAPGIGRSDFRADLGPILGVAE